VWLISIDVGKYPEPELKPELEKSLESIIKLILRV